MLKHKVAFPLGLVEVRLERSDLDLNDRGGFEASWAVEGEGLAPEAYRSIFKTYLHDLYVARHGAEPGKVALNLASHQLLDDITGWTKLNYQSKPVSGDS